MKYGPDNFYELDIGTVFSADGKTWWKVTGYSGKTDARTYNFWEKATYNVVRCNKNGLEFKQTNGFWAVEMHKRLKSNLITIAGVFKEPVKVSTAGKKIGIKKRRIDWLKATIAAHQAELTTLEQEIKESL